jgi:hypothetical protein
MYTALRATSLTIANLLQQHFIADTNLRLLFDPAHGGTMVISLNSPEEMTENKEQGVSVWLYLVNKDGERLNDSMERLSRTELLHRPLPLSLHYLVTPIVALKNKHNSPQTEQIILGKVLQVLHDHPILSGSLLQDDFTGKDLQINIHLEPLTVDETARLFDALERSYGLAISYQVSLVMIDSEQQPLTVSPVAVAGPDYSIEVGS